MTRERSIVVSLLLCMSCACAGAADTANTAESPEVKALLAKRDLPQLSGTIHWQQLGDRGFKAGEWANERLRIEAVTLTIDDVPEDTLRIETRCHVEGFGDVGWMTESSRCGTTGQKRRLEAIGIKLAGPAAQFFTVKYDCYVSGQSNPQGATGKGDLCGTTGKSLPLVGLKVWIERK